MNIYGMTEGQRADARKNGVYYVVNLKDKDDSFAEWFESNIDGTYDECYAEVGNQSLDGHYHVQIVEG